MWNPFSRSTDDAELDLDLDLDDQEDEQVDAAALRILARWVLEHDGLPANGAVIDRMFVVGTARH